VRADAGRDGGVNSDNGGARDGTLTCAGIGWQTDGGLPLRHTFQSHLAWAGRPAALLNLDLAHKQDNK